MATIEEIRAQAEAAGKSEQEIRQMIAQEVNAGTITTVAPPIEYKSFSEMEEPPQQLGGLMGVASDIYRRGERKGGFKGQVMGVLSAAEKAMLESQPFTRYQREGQLRQELATGQKSEARIAKEAALAPTPEAPPDLSPGKGAFGGGEIPPPSAPGGGFRPVPFPKPEELGAAQEGRQSSLERQMADIGTLASAREKLTQDLTKLEVTEIEAAREITDKRQLDYEDMQVKHRRRENDRQSYIKGEMSKIQGVVDQLQTAEIDPYSFYKHPDGSTNYPKSIAAAIAVGLGALGSSLPAQYGGTGGPNVAMQIIDKAIGREIAAQRDDVANKRAGVGLQMNLLTQMRGVLDNEGLADKGAELALLKTAELKLADSLMQTKDKKAKLNGQLIMQGIAEKEFTLRNEIENLANDKRVEDEKIQYGIERQAAAAQQKARSATAKAAGPVLKGFRAWRPVKPDELKEARKVSDAFNDSVGSIKALTQLREDMGAEAWPAYVSANRGLMEAERSIFVMSLGVALEIGALQQHEMEMLDRMVPNVDSFGKVLPQLGRMALIMERRFNSRMFNRGFVPGGPGTATAGAKKRKK